MQKLILFILFIALVSILWVKLRQVLAAPPRRQPHFRTEAETEQHYARVLEITSPSNPKEVQRMYRALIGKYHPDRVQHLGQEFQHIAEKKTKELNEAYRYFREKYKF